MPRGGARPTPGRRRSAALLLCHYPGTPLVLEAVTLAADLHHGGMVEQAVEHGGGQHRLAREGLVPTAEGQVRGEYHGAALVTPAHHLEEQVGLLAAHRQVTDLV